MTQDLGQIASDTEYFVLNDSLKQRSDETALTNLYLPILGPSAVAVYRLLWEQSIADQNRLVLHTHFQLQEMIGTDLNTISHLRKELEAVKLIQTYVSPEHKDCLIFQINLPLTVNDFFESSVLSALLYEKVGDTAYQRLQVNSRNTIPTIHGLTNVSAKIADVFSQNSSVSPSKIKIDQTDKPQDKKTGPVIGPDSTEFDFKLLLETLDNSYVDLTSVKKNRDLIVAENMLYGVDELAMGTAIQEATNLSTDQLDPQRLKQILYRKANRPQLTVNNVTDMGTENTSVKNSKGDVKPVVQQLIKITKNAAPVAFLQQIKQQKHGFATSGEQRILRELIDRRILPNDVINILIYHVLIDQNRVTLNKNLVDTIANDWAQGDVKNAEDAIGAITSHKQSHEAKSGTRKRPRSKGNVKETLPEWAKDGINNSNDNKSVEMSAQQKQEIEKALAQLKKQK